MRSLSSLLLSSGSGALGGECPSSFALVVAPALPPLRFCASAYGGWLRPRAGGIPRVASGRAARPAQGRLPRGHGAGGAQCSRVESRRDTLLAAQPTVGGAAAVVHFTDAGQQPTPVARATWGSVGSRRLIPTAQASARALACRPAPPRRGD